MTKLKIKLQEKTTPSLFFFAFLGVIALALFSFKLEKKGHLLGLIKDGVGTCFHRVSQSYTAQLIGESRSTYLQNPFLTMTEECFGQSLHLLEDLQLTPQESALKILNTMSNETYAFHQKLSYSSLPQELYHSHLAGLFEKLENKKDRLGERIEFHQIKTKKWLRGIHFFFLFFLWPLLGFGFLYLSLLLRQQKRIRELSLELDETKQDRLAGQSEMVVSGHPRIRREQMKRVWKGRSSPPPQKRI